MKPGELQFPLWAVHTGDAEIRNPSPLARCKLGRQWQPMALSSQRWPRRGAQSSREAGAGQEAEAVSSPGGGTLQERLGRRGRREGRRTHDPSRRSDGALRISIRGPRPSPPGDALPGRGAASAAVPAAAWLWTEATHVQRTEQSCLGSYSLYWSYWLAPQ